MHEAARVDANENPTGYLRGFSPGSRPGHTPTMTARTFPIEDDSQWNLRNTSQAIENRTEEHQFDPSIASFDTRQPPR